VRRIAAVWGCRARDLPNHFSGDRAQTCLRRAKRRVQVSNASRLQDYIERLNSEHTELLALFRDLLIRITSFFRDKDIFEVL